MSIKTPFIIVFSGLILLTTSCSKIDESTPKYTITAPGTTNVWKHCDIIMWQYSGYIEFRTDDGRTISLSQYIVEKEE